MASARREEGILDDLPQGVHHPGSTWAPNPHLTPKMIGTLATTVQLTVSHTTHPRRTNPLQMDSYDGTTDLDEHIKNIEVVLTYKLVRGAVKCKLFVITL